MTRRVLLQQFLRKYPFQPATAYWRAVEIAEVLARPPMQGTVLDLGCGDGKLTAIIDYDWGGQRRWIGLDPDPLETRAAKEAELYVEVFTARGDAIPLRAASVDGIFSNSVLEHIPEVGPVLADAARVLRPGGRFLITVPAASFHAALAGPLFGSGRGEYLRKLDQRLAHYYYLDADGWTRTLASHGLKVICTKPFLTQRQTQRWESLSRITGGALHMLSGSKLRPIEIQRALGVRTGREKMPRFLARGLGQMLAGPIDDDVAPGEPFGCLLIEATRAAS